MGFPRKRPAALAAIIVMALVAGPAPRTQADGLLVFAAASLQESLTAAADAWAAEGKPRPVLAFAASSALARQIENGAPAALFVSADEQWMDYLADRSLLAPGTRTALLRNELVLVASTLRSFQVDIQWGFPLATLLGDGKLAMADPDSVPAGRYGKAALVSLGVWTPVEASVARTGDVRAALALVERDEARAGIVYRTDALVSKKVVVAGTFPAGSHPPIVYPMAIVAGHDAAEARAFREFLGSERGRAVFAGFGFSTLPLANSMEQDARPAGKPKG